MATGSLAGCELFVRDRGGNGGGNGNGEPTCPGDPACPDPAITVHDVRDPARRAALPEGEAVTLEGLVVTAARARQVGGETRYDVYVQDPAGGPWSAIELAALASRPERGTVLTVTGIYESFFGQDRLAAVTYEITATTEPPAPTLFSDPASLATSGADAYPWQSALVGVEHVVVTDPRVLGTDGVWRGDFRITGGLVVGRVFPHDYEPIADDHLIGITGVLAYSFQDSRLQPRDNDDLVRVDGEPAGPPVVTIPELRAWDGDLSGDGRLVRLEDVIVTAVSVPDNRGRRNLFVQEAEGGPYSGVYVFNQPELDVSGLAPGHRIHLEGRHTRRSLPGDSRPHDQIALRALEVVGPGDAPAPALFEDPGELVDPEKSAEAYEGVLVRIVDVGVTEAANQYGEVALAAAPKLHPVLVGTPALAHLSPGDHLASATGVVQWRFGYAILPRTADDLVLGVAPEPPEPEIVEIADVRDPTRRAELGDGPYTIEGIVTAVRPRSGRYDVFVQDDTPGPYRGITVAFVTPAPEPGDVVRVTGGYESFYGWDRLASATIEILETGGPLPEALVVDPADVATGGADAFSHQSLLLRVEDVTVVEDRVLGTDGEWRGDFEVEGGLVVGRWFFHGYDAVEDDAFASITGVLRFAFDESRLEPRTSADLVFEEGEVPPDPDPDPAPLVATIPQLRDPDHPNHPEPGAWVEVAEAVVTAVRIRMRSDLTTYVDGFTIQTPATTAPWHGLYVHTPERPPPEDVRVGDLFRVRGELGTFLGRPQIEADEIEALGEADALPAPHVIEDPAVFGDDDAIAPWFGILARVEKPEADLEITEGSDPYGEYRVDDVMGVRSFFFDHPATTGDRFRSMTGIVGYFETFSGEFAGFRLWPRSAEDLEAP